MASWYGWTS